MNEFSKVFKNKNFLALAISQVLSQLTINILSFIILIHLFNETGSTIASSLLWVAYAVPAIVFGPVAAAWIDLLDKRKVLVISNFLQSAVVLLYAIFLYRKLVYLSYTIVFLYSLLNQFYVPAEAAELPVIVKEKELPAANGIFFLTQQSSLVIGFGTAGVLDQIFGFRPTLFLVAFCLFAAGISVSFLPASKIQFRLPKSFEKSFSLFFEQIIEGYNFIKNNRKILFPFLLLLGVQVIMAVVVVNLPKLSTDILKIPTGSSGFMVVVPAGIGAIIGTLAVSRLTDLKIQKRRIVLLSLITLAVSILSVGIVLPFMATGLIKTMTGILLFVITGFGAVGTLVPCITYLQEKTPKDLLGRVFGNFWFLTTVATVPPVIFSATITDLFGIQALLLLLGMTTLIVTIYSSYKVNEL